MTFSITDYIAQRIHRLEQFLSTELNRETASPLLTRAMDYALFSGGKRIRALLVYATGEAFSVPLSHLDLPAAAIECIHAFSLVHDDLPAMDDDDFRRGKPSCHNAFNEAIAILAGDALQTFAFELLSSRMAEQTLSPATCFQLMRLIATATGKLGMSGGQALEFTPRAHPWTVPEVEAVHHLKTGALIRASVAMALACTTDLPETTHTALMQFATDLGLIFQIQDDLFDLAEDGHTPEKPSDQIPGYPALSGIAVAQNYLEDLSTHAHAALSTLDDRAKPLRTLLTFILDRKH